MCVCVCAYVTRERPIRYVALELGPHNHGCNGQAASGQKEFVASRSRATLASGSCLLLLAAPPLLPLLCAAATSGYSERLLHIAGAIARPSQWCVCRAPRAQRRIVVAPGAVTFTCAHAAHSARRPSLRASSGCARVGSWTRRPRSRERPQPASQRASARRRKRRNGESKSQLLSRAARCVTRWHAQQQQPPAAD